MDYDKWSALSIDEKIEQAIKLSNGDTNLLITQMDLIINIILAKADAEDSYFHDVTEKGRINKIIRNIEKEFNNQQPSQRRIFLIQGFMYSVLSALFNLEKLDALTAYYDMVAAFHFMETQKPYMQDREAETRVCHIYIEPPVMQLVAFIA